MPVSATRRWRICRNDNAGGGQQHQPSQPQQTPQQNAQKRVPGRVYATTAEELEKGNLVQGTVIVNGCAALVLFDCGATHSFISIEFAKLLGAPTESLKHELYVYNPIGYNSVCVNYIPDVIIVLEGQNLPADLILLDMTEYDVILGMDWLYEHYANVLCRPRESGFVPTRIAKG